MLIFLGFSDWVMNFNFSVFWKHSQSHLFVSLELLVFDCQVLFYSQKGKSWLCFSIFYLLSYTLVVLMINNFGNSFLDWASSESRY